MVGNTKYSRGHMLADPSFPGPIIDQIANAHSLMECGGLCKAKSNCYGYSYDKDACSLYLEVLHSEDFTDTIDDPLIYFEKGRVSHPVS